MLGRSARWMALCAVAIALITFDVRALETDVRILRMGTGGTGGTYFPIGSLIAHNMSASRAGDGQSRGVPGLLVVAQISNGSVSNVDDLRAGLLDAALVQSDVAYWAFHSMAIFEGRPRQQQLRVVAHLYPESLHLVARIGSGITTIEDLRGKRVSLDEPGSGTVLDARFVLQHYGIHERDLISRYLKPHFAVQAMERGELDAFFVFAGYPVTVINKLAASTGAHLVPIEGPVVEAILQAHPYFSRGVIPSDTYGRGVIPAGTYKGVGDTPTITVGAQLIVRADLDDDVVYAMTRAMWSDAAVKTMREGHPKGAEVSLQHALHGVSIPVHPGAKRFYREAGIALPTARRGD